METKYCDHCGQKVDKYKVPLTEGILRALIKFRQAVSLKNENKIHLLEDMKGDVELTRHEWNNFTRLRFHALVAKYKEDGQHISGYWLLTKRGAQFLNGETDIPKTVTVFNNRVVEHSEERVFIKDVIGRQPYFEKISDITYEPATDEDIEKTKVAKKKKKVKNPCPQCGGKMAIKHETKFNEETNQVKIVRTYLKCPTCGEEDFIL